MSDKTELKRAKHKGVEDINEIYAMLDEIGRAHV